MTIIAIFLGICVLWGIVKGLSDSGSSSGSQSESDDNSPDSVERLIALAAMWEMLHDKGDNDDE